MPGVTISLKNLGTQILESGKTGCKIQLMSKKNSREIPFPSTIINTIFLRDTDFTRLSKCQSNSGIFEYLLGEILRVVSEKGKGQLIFTSHNLRPPGHNLIQYNIHIINYFFHNLYLFSGDNSRLVKWKHYLTNCTAALFLIFKCQRKCIHV